MIAVLHSCLKTKLSVASFGAPTVKLPDILRNRDRSPDASRTPDRGTDSGELTATDQKSRQSDWFSYNRLRHAATMPAQTSTTTSDLAYKCPYKVSVDCQSATRVLPDSLPFSGVTSFTTCLAMQILLRFCTSTHCRLRRSFTKSGVTHPMACTTTNAANNHPGLSGLTNTKMPANSNAVSASFPASPA